MNQVSGKIITPTLTHYELNATSNNDASSDTEIAEVTATTEATVYLYNPSNLWIAYGLAILFSTFSVLVGGYALRRNRASYDACVSTFAIAMQDEEVRMLQFIY